MKSLLLRIWNGKAGTVAGAIAAGLAYVVAADIDLPQGWAVGLGALGVVLGAFAGPVEK